MSGSQYTYSLQSGFLFIIQYVDDIQFVHTGSIDDLDDLIYRSEETLKLAKAYFNNNGLMLNTKKTQCMFIGSVLRNNEEERGEERRSFGDKVNEEERS